MKKHIILFSVALLVNLNTNAQVLYSENFDNLMVGNIGTDVTGQIPGQGGWYTLAPTNFFTNTDYQIVSSNITNKYILLKSAPSGSYGRNEISKKGIDVLWANRIAGNDVLKFEYEIYIDNLSNNGSILNDFCTAVYIRCNAINQDIGIVGNEFFPYTANFNGRYHDSNSFNSFNYGIGNIYSLIKNNWLKLVIYIDYNNKVAVFDVPQLNLRKQTNILQKLPSTANLNNYYPTSIHITSGNLSTTRPVGEHKFDNFKISAINEVPLSVNEFLNEKFNIFPNPTTNIVNITNDDNITIDKISIYDVSGKLIKETNYNAESSIHLNIEDLQSGNYLLHIETNLGTAVKKIIKQ